MAGRLRELGGAMLRFTVLFLVAVPSALATGCATQKESHTPRTGVEQLLISSAVDQSLDQIDLSPLQQRSVYLETKYLDCVDKNYIIVAMHQRILANQAKLVDKPEGADVIVEVCSGAVGTDGSELFVGIPEIPLPPPSPVAIPRLSLLTRTRLYGTARVLVVAYDAKTRQPLINTGSTLARSDYNNWNILGAGPMQTGQIPDQIATATGEVDLNVISLTRAARDSLAPAEVVQDPPQVMPAARSDVPSTPRSR